MKNIIAILAISLVISSCSNDKNNSTTKEEVVTENKLVEELPPLKTCTSDIGRIVSFPFFRTI